LNRKSGFAGEINVFGFPATEPVKIADAPGSRRTDKNRDLATTRARATPHRGDLRIEF